MSSSMSHEEEIIKEIKELPEMELPRILRLIRFFRTEMIDRNRHEKRESTGFCGIWEDDRSADEIIRDISSHRTGFGNRETVQ
jgi:hypothetical protein